MVMQLILSIVMIVAGIVLFYVRHKYLKQPNRKYSSNPAEG
jgi:prolipoprotein diacylglyceryltransferase